MSRHLVRASFASLSLSLAFLFGSSPAHGQAQLVRSGGVMGESVVYTASAPQPSYAVLFFSFIEGPTPLSFFDRADNRALNLGLDLFSVGIYTFFTAVPEGHVLAYVLPKNSFLIGFQLRTQFVTMSVEGPYLVDQISNWTGTVIGPSGLQHLTPSEREYGTDAHTATLLPDGRVLLAGGVDLSDEGNVTAGTEFYDPQQQCFVPGPPLPTPRAGHMATLLLDGRVLLTGGAGTNGAVHRGAVLVDPIVGTAVPAASMALARLGHTATRMSDGRVVVVGGFSSLGSGSSSLQLAEASIEVYDPATDSWSFGPSMTERRVGHAAALDGDGRVLVAGGFTSPISMGSCLANCITNSAFLITKKGGALSIVSTEALPQPLALMTLHSTPSGDVLAVGGLQEEGATFSAVKKVFRFQHGLLEWEQLPDLEEPRIEPSVVPIDGGYAVIGGLSGDLISLPGTLFILTKSLDLYGNFLGPDLPEGIADEPTVELRDEEFDLWKEKNPPKKFPMVELRRRAVSVAVDEGARVLTTGASLSGTPSSSILGELLLL